MAMKDFLIVMMAVLVSGAILVGGYMYFFGEDEVPAGAPGVTPPSQQGELASLKYSVETVAQDNPGQYPGTGYCWDVAKPDELLESRNGKTLSATAGTSFAPVTRGRTYECASFGASNFCSHDSATMADEALPLRSECRNYTSQGNFLFVPYENDVAETTNSLSVGAGGVGQYNKFRIQVNGTDLSYPLKAICFGTNVSNSNVRTMDMKNWNSDLVPEGLDSSHDDYCFSQTEAILFDEWDQKILLDAIIFEGTSTGTGSNEETISVTFMDECEYVAIDGSVKKDYFKRDTANQADCGTTNLNATILLT